ncbi:MAG: WD40 repeat domain-containing protein [Spirochaetaceae bacterium]
MRRLLTLFVFLLLASTIGAEGVVLRTAHVDAVSAMLFDEDRNLLVTGGVDGKIKVWDLETDALRHSTQISNLAILDVALHPSRPEVAIVESDENLRYRLTIWDWEEREALYTRNLSAEPLHLSYSPQGTYVVVSEAAFRSMRLFNARTGREEEYLQRGFGIVSYFAVAGSETRVMTYSANNGEIIYWDLESGFEIQRSDSEPGLEHMRLFGNRRYAAGVRHRTLYLVDVLGGQVVDTVSLGATPLDVVIESDGESLSLLVSENSGERALQSYALRGGRLNRRYSTRYRSIPEEVSLIRYAGEELFAARRDGTIYRYRRYQRSPTLFAENLIQPITDIARGEGELLLASNGRLLTLSSDLFEARDVRLEEVDRMEDSYASLPLSEEIRFTQTPDGSTYIWSEAANGEIYRMGRFSTFRPLELPSSGRLTAISSTLPNRLVLVTRDGRVSILDVISREEIFSVQALGIETAIETEDHGLLIGKSVTGQLDSALLRIDPNTGETVPLDTELFLIYRLGYDERSRRLYALGLRRDAQNRVETVLQSFSGNDLERRRTLFSVEGEFLNADLAVDSDRREMFTTLGESRVRRYDGSRFQEFVRDVHQTRTMSLFGGLVLGLNRDGSLSIWSRESREYLATLYLLGSRRWIAITAEGRFVASRGLNPEEYLSAPEGDEVSEYRVRL